MKKIVGSLAIIFASTVSMNAQKLVYKNLKDATVDYGTITQNADGNRTVQVKNTGDKPLIISNVQPTCGCTIADWTKKPIKPGGKGEIKIKYATTNIGSFGKQINITSNDVSSPTSTIKIIGNVIAPPKATTAGK